MEKLRRDDRIRALRRADTERHRSAPTRARAPQATRRRAAGNLFPSTVENQGHRAFSLAAPRSQESRGRDCFLGCTFSSAIHLASHRPHRAAPKSAEPGPRAFSFSCACVELVRSNECRKLLAALPGQAPRGCHRRAARRVTGCRLVRDPASQVRHLDRQRSPTHSANLDRSQSVERGFRCIRHRARRESARR